VLDVAYNQLREVSGLGPCPKLEELWLNMNRIEDPSQTLKAL
jgi:Leucine-rich repeat (LRR) protein